MSRTWGRLGKAAFVVVAIVAGKELATSLPDESATFRPFEVSGEVGAPVQLRTGTVEVLDVQLGQTVLTPSAGYRTPGLWVAVRARLTPSLERATFGYVAVRAADGERTWEWRTRSVPHCPPPPTGVPVTCDLILEVPAEALEGAELLVSTEADHRHDSLGVIDLGIGAAQVEAAQADEEPLEVGEAVIGGGDG